MKIVLKNDKSTRVEWSDEGRFALSIYRARQSVPFFAAEASHIWDWDDAPQSVRDRAIEMMRRAGRSGTPAIVCGHPTMGPVIAISTPDLAARVRELLPAARAAEDARKAAAEAAEAQRKEDLARRKAAALAACPPGYEACTKGRFFDGLVACVAADGTTVDQWDDIDDHGCGIVYVPRDVLQRQRERDADARAAAEAQRKEDEARAAEAARHEAECLRKARETGDRVAIRTYSVPCRDQREECNLDIATVWAMPDGGKITTYEHTW